MLILSHSKQKGGLIREMTSLKGDNLVVLNYLSAFEIWPDKRGGLWWEGMIRGVAFGGRGLMRRWSTGFILRRLKSGIIFVSYLTDFRDFPLEREIAESCWQQSEQITNERECI
jgi:hypothetical protein